MEHLLDTKRYPRNRNTKLGLKLMFSDSGFPAYFGGEVMMLLQAFKTNKKMEEFGYRIQPGGVKSVTQRARSTCWAH